MTLNEIAEIWDVMSRGLESGSPEAAATDLVAYLVDNTNFTQKKLEEAFSDNEYMLEALEWHFGGLESDFSNKKKVTKEELFDEIDHYGDFEDD